MGGNRCSSKVDSCDSDAEEGYSADYVPEASSPLDVHYDVDMINGNDSLIIGTSNPFNCSLFAGEINLSFTLSLVVQVVQAQAQVHAMNEFGKIRANCMISRETFQSYHVMLLNEMFFDKVQVIEWCDESSFRTIQAISSET